MAPQRATLEKIETDINKLKMLPPGLLLPLGSRLRIYHDLPESSKPFDSFVLEVTGELVKVIDPFGSRDETYDAVPVRFPDAISVDAYNCYHIRRCSLSTESADLSCKCVNGDNVVYDSLVLGEFHILGVETTEEIPQYDL